MRKKQLAGLVIAMAVTSSSAFAAVTEGSISVSPLIGGYVYGSNQQLNPNLLVGVRGGYSITKEIGVEAVYDYVAPTDSKLFGVKNISLHRFGAQVLYHYAPDRQFVPYLAAGLSGITFAGSGVNHTTRAAFDYGAGAKYFVTDDIAVRTDIRHLVYGYNATTYNNVEIMLGVTYQFERIR